MRAIAAGLGLYATLPAVAATVFGTLYLPNGQPAPNVAIVLACSGVSTRGRTDSHGTYRLTVNGSGRCTLRTTGANDGAEVVLFEQSPSQYSFILHGGGAAARLTRR